MPKASAYQTTAGLLMGLKAHRSQFYAQSDENVTQVDSCSREKHLTSLKISMPCLNVLNVGCFLRGSLIYIIFVYEELKLALLTWLYL